MIVWTKQPKQFGDNLIMKMLVSRWPNALLNSDPSAMQVQHSLHFTSALANIVCGDTGRDFVPCKTCSNILAGKETP